MIDIGWKCGHLFAKTQNPRIIYLFIYQILIKSFFFK